MAQKNRPKKITRREKHFHPTEKTLEKRREVRAELKRLDKLLPIEIREYN